MLCALLDRTDPWDQLESTMLSKAKILWNFFVELYQVYWFDKCVDVLTGSFSCSSLSMNQDNPMLFHAIKYFISCEGKVMTLLS